MSVILGKASMGRHFVAVAAASVTVQGPLELEVSAASGIELEVVDPTIEVAIFPDSIVIPD